MSLLQSLHFGGESEQLYYIKNKDRILGSFRWEDDDIAELVEDIALPFFITDDFADWIQSRTPPKHREHIAQLLQQCGLSTLRSIIDFGKGLNLTDTLWVTPDEHTPWNSVSLFQNSFDEVIARIAFDGGLHGIPLSTTSPELGTNGMLAKCWVRGEDESISLIKTGTTGASNAGNEPYSENLAHQLLSRLDYTHVPYSVCRYRKRLVSMCPLMTSESVMLLPIWKFYNFRSIDKLLDLCKRDGIAEGLAQHLVFDYLSWNTDRHAGNLGVLLDADNFQLIGFSPIFDNGCAMLNYWNGEEDLDVYTTHSTPALYDSFEYGAKLGKRVLGSAHNVERLIGFRFDRSQIFGYPDSRVDAIETWLQGRVQYFLGIR